MSSKKNDDLQYLIPINSVVYVSTEKVVTLSAGKIKLDLIGEKAFGLACLPKLWTLPFLVVSDSLLSDYRSSSNEKKPEILQDWVARISRAVKKIGIYSNARIIVRSSSQSEGLSERGRFHSVQGASGDLSSPLEKCLHKIISDDELGEATVPLIIQEYADPVSLTGHLSNERRCYKEGRDWLGEIDGGDTFTINLRNWRRKIDPAKATNAQLECNLTAHVISKLKIPAAWAHSQSKRIHFEWVWDGTNIFIVQADQEYHSSGVDPTIQATHLGDAPSDFVPEILVPINEHHAQKFPKIHNVFTYMKLGLPFTNLYVLEDQTVIKELSSGKVFDSLKHDLSELVKGSLVIRLDIESENQKDRQLLPRSDEVRQLSEALEWLKTTTKKIKEDGFKGKVVFIFHNFIPAVSSAFAYAAPGQRKVQIEALWGLPEGLYYNSHDKYIVDTKKTKVQGIAKEDIDKFEVQFIPSYKHFFVTPDIDGRWTTKAVKIPYDWNGSITQDSWVKTIALESRRIADEVGTSLSIMWFVGVSDDICKEPVFPWFHEFFDPDITSRAAEHRTKTPFDKSLIIKTEKDIEALKKEVENPTSMVRKIRIQPREDSLLRNKNTLRDIGELAQEINAVILLEGGVLSHAYYQLMQTNAIVEVSHTFSKDKEKREFNKLVRDKVPANIENGGENVSKTQLTGEYFLRALKEKLIEEAFEVLDAVDQEDIVAELADVSEVVDGILSKLGVNKRELSKRQGEKRSKAGGFNEGLVLLRTGNPVSAKVKGGESKEMFTPDSIKPKQYASQVESEKILSLGNQVSKWSDRRKLEGAIESILDLEVPVTRDMWTAPLREAVVKTEHGDEIKIQISGERKGSKIKINLSLFVPDSDDQIKLFDD